ncbi:MAG: hypothetical protein BroJett025_07930 [Patescibacteria group bacterium]|nr:MAG: hypothetical protein BroJett025_07930 [Patescibacteria group bacterium]
MAIDDDKAQILSGIEESVAAQQAYAAEINKKEKHLAELAEALPDVEALEDALGLLYHWDHTGNPDRAISGNIDQAVEVITQFQRQFQEMLLQVDGEDKAEITQRGQAILSNFEESLAGFQYRKENGLQNVRNQKRQIRKAMTLSIHDPEQSRLARELMMQLQRQPDAQLDVTELQAEYQEIGNLAEAFNESGANFTADIDELGKRVAESTRDVSDYRPTMEQIRAAHEGLQQLQQNYELLKRLAELQNAQGIMERIAENLSYRKTEIGEAVVKVVNGVLHDIRKARDGSLFLTELLGSDFRELPLDERFAAAAKVLAEELEEARRLAAKADELKAKWDEKEKLLERKERARKGVLGNATAPLANALLGKMGRQTPEEKITALRNEVRDLRLQTVRAQNAVKALEKFEDSAVTILAEVEAFTKGNL